MRWMRLILIAASTATASCSWFGRMQPEGRPVMDVAGGPALTVAESSPIRAPKTVPVLSPPEVFAVYVTSHVDRERDFLVGEHWVFFKLSESEWFSERRLAAAPKAAGTATPDQLEPLRSLGNLDRALVPHRESKP